jgi:hypothetical protein
MARLGRADSIASGQRQSVLAGRGRDSCDQRTLSGTILAGTLPALGSQSRGFRTVSLASLRTAALVPVLRVASEHASPDRQGNFATLSDSIRLLFPLSLARPQPPAPSAMPVSCLFPATSTPYSSGAGRFARDVKPAPSFSTGRSRQILPFHIVPFQPSLISATRTPRLSKVAWVYSIGTWAQIGIGESRARSLVHRRHSICGLRTADPAASSIEAAICLAGAFSRYSALLRWLFSNGLN